MKKTVIATLAALLMLGVLPGQAGDRWVERHSTDPGRDLDRISFAGKITSIRGQQAQVALDDGGEMTVHLGPQWYWRERGYRLRTGLHVEVSGWSDRGSDSYCFAGAIWGDGFHFELSDSHGYPRWAYPDDYCVGWRPHLRSFEIHYYHPPRFAPRWWWHRPHRPYYWHHRPWPHHPGPPPPGHRPPGHRRDPHPRPHGPRHPR